MPEQAWNEDKGAFDTEHDDRHRDLAAERANAKAVFDHEPETRTVSSTGGEKGDKLARYDLIPVEPLRQLAEHYGAGARKYADRNWEKGYDWHLSYAAMQRHANAFWGGEDIDPETGNHHMMGVMFHAMALVEYGRTHPEFDDRPVRQALDDLAKVSDIGAHRATADDILKEVPGVDFSEH